MSSTVNDHQIAWLPGERLVVALDARKGAVTSGADGRSLLTVTTHRAIKVGVEAGKRVTSITPLDKISAIEIIDVARPGERLVQGLVVLGAGAVLGYLSWVIVGVALVSLIVGGLPILASVYMLAGFAFPDEDGELILHAGTHLVRQPLLSGDARRDSYVVAQRIYELMVAPATTAPQPPPPAPSSPPSLDVTQRVAPRIHVTDAVRVAAEATNGHSDGLQEVVAGLPIHFPVTAKAASGEMDALMGISLETVERHADASTEAVEHVRRSVSAASNAKSYVTRQVARDPSQSRLDEGDFIWDMEFVGPDAHRIYQTAWSGGSSVSDQWVSIGGDFYRAAGGSWTLKTDVIRFADELALGRRLQVDNYTALLLSGAPQVVEVHSYGDRTYLYLEYHSLDRTLLSRLLDNPSPSQGLRCDARLWLDLGTDHLTKAEITFEDAQGGQAMRLEQVFTGFDASSSIDVPAPQPAGDPYAGWAG